LKEEEKYEEGDKSQHMVARWYRPPEIILNSCVYDSKVDIWSIGCVFAELMYTWLPGKHDPNKRILFRGNSCYPLTPIGGVDKEVDNANIISSND